MNDLFKLIFLDIDGVLNSEEWFSERMNLEKQYAYPYGKFSPKLIENFNKIIEKTNASIVISSTWRLSRTREEMEQLFNIMGIQGEIIGFTPCLPGEPIGEEIKAWLDVWQNPFNIENYKAPNTTTYAIIDDDSDFLEEQQPSFFQTGWKDGLTEEKANLIIDFFKKDVDFVRDLNILHV